MEQDVFGKIWSDNVKKFVLIAALMMIIGSFLPGISMNGTSATWLDTKNYGFLFPLAGVVAGASLFLNGHTAFYLMTGGIAVAGFLVGINLMDLLRAVDYGATLSIGFYVYIAGIALGAYALYLSNAQQKGKSAVKLNLKPLITKENLPAPEAPQVKLETNAKFCPQCGTKNEVSSNFCVKCGTKLPN